MIEALINLLVPVVAILALLMLVGFVLARLYRRATREVSLVKTGAGGRQVIMDGGVIVVPLLHEISRVNMKTLRLEVYRHGDAALITKDRMRVDVGVEFYVSVNATVEGVARAARTLGERTFDVIQLRDMIEGKLVDGLRAVAAQMTMDQLHENRSDFVQEVHNAVSEDLLKNGLELESVSLTGLDQTPFDALDENNAFNAVGMRQLAEVIADSKKRRAEIDASADIAVRMAALTAEKRKIELAQEEEAVRLAQAQQIETMRAAQEAEIAKQRMEGERAAEEARIAKEREVRAAEIVREQSIRAAEIDKERAIEVADQERAIVIAQKSEEESRARASADAARAEAIAATESIATARNVAEAERAKRIALIDATREAEREATQIRLSAEAEKHAAADRAEARREAAQAEADAMSIKAAARKTELLAEAEGKRAITEAENALSTAIIEMKIALARLEALPGIAAEMVRPAEKIGSIKIHQVTGFGGVGGGASGAANGVAASPVQQAVDAIAGMAVQLPALKKLGEEVGVSLEDGVAGVMAAAAGTGQKNGCASTEPPAAEGHKEGA
ncbi:MAG: flotillin [Rhodobacteraceae bacterium]|nr:flotillin [Paracoccaceae bacterium]